MKLLKMLISLLGTLIVIGILEFSKTILFSDNEKAKKEVKKVSSYIFKQILNFSYILLFHLLLKNLVKK